MANLCTFWHSTWSNMKSLTRTWKSTKDVPFRVQRKERKQINLERQRNACIQTAMVSYTPDSPDISGECTRWAASSIMIFFKCKLMILTLRWFNLSALSKLRISWSGSKQLKIMVYCVIIFWFVNLIIIY